MSLHRARDGLREARRSAHRSRTARCRDGVRRAREYRVRRGERRTGTESHGHALCARPALALVPQGLDLTPVMLEQLGRLVHLEPHRLVAGASVGIPRPHDALWVQVLDDVLAKERGELLELLGGQVLEPHAVPLAIEHEPAHDLVRLAEGQPALGKVVRHVRRRRKAQACLGKHLMRVDLPAVYHALHADHGVTQGVRGVDGTLLALLEILVVGQRQRLHGDQKPHEVTVDASRLAARELGEVGVLLLRHDGRARGVGVRERDKAELRRGPGDDLLAETREVHHAHAAGIEQVNQVVAVAHGVHRVGNRMVKAQKLGRVEAIERVGGAGEGCRAKRAGVRRLVGSHEARIVAREHPEIGEQVVGEEYRLGMLHVGVTRHDGAKVLACGADDDLAQGVVLGDKGHEQVLGIEADVGRHLIVTRAPRVQACPGSAYVLDELGLHGHVDVLVVDIPLELALVYLVLNLKEAHLYVLDVGVREDPLPAQHPRVRDGARDVLLVHSLVDGQRRPKALRELAHALLEPT